MRLVSLVLILSFFYAPFANAEDSDHARASFEELAGPSAVPFDGAVLYRRDDLLAGIDANLSFLKSPTADLAYQKFDDRQITKSRVEKSLLRFKELLIENSDPELLRKAVEKEFILYQSTGHDGRGTVKFTGYFQPVYKASRKRSREFPYPLYKAPDNFLSWQKPHPTRTALEGYDGKGNPTGPLRGLELAWLKSRYEVFMVQVQGSAILELSDGTTMSVGFAGGTDYPFRGIPRSFLRSRDVSWSHLKTYFAENPEDLNELLSKNNRFIFFKENSTSAPMGSLGVPVIPERSIATDKLKLPPGALGVIRTSVPHLDERGRVQKVQGTQIVLDQDTGSAIKGPGRVDIFMGTGSDAQKKANSISSNGELYYLLLRASDNT